MLISDVFAFLLVFSKILMTAVGVAFLVSGLDDFFIDLCFGIRSLYRRWYVLPKHPPMTESMLREKKEQRIAVMIPAWDESAVIRLMLENTLRSLDYANYTIFVGTYPNDVNTHQEVEMVREKHASVQRIVCPHDGPTNKADCLNWIYQGIRLYEKQHGVSYDIFVMQDCEDVIHPLCYKLFNYLIPRKDMVQLPVHSLRMKWHQFTAGHYLDEFAQCHYKDMVVREALSACLPAAGVGCAFSRKAFTIVCGQNNNQLFSIDSLTEDYDFGFRLHEHKLKQVFVRFALNRKETQSSFWTGKPVAVTRREVVCIHEFFPAKFKFSVKQKSRWVLGITLQGWANLGWKGSLATKYMLFRDRKSIFTNLLNLLGYLLVLVVLSIWLVNWLNPDAYRYPPLLEKGSLLWDVLYFNAFLLVVRVFQRFYCVYQLYGTPQALLSIPRMVWGNVINFLATSRAISQYLAYLRTGTLIKWDKTNHQYPSESELLSFRRKLGDLLLDSRCITPHQLTEALAVQKSKPLRLGEILTELGWLEEDDLMQMLQRQ